MAARTTISVLGPFLAVVVLGSSVACFDSDELRSNNTTETTAAETVAVYGTDTTDGIDENWTAEESGPGETTCRDAIECLVMCQSLLVFNNDPEPDYSCFLECDMGLTTEEAYKLIKLAECIGNKCATDPDGAGPEIAPCGDEASDNDCLICIAANGNDPQPQGCIEEAAACE